MSAYNFKEGSIMSIFIYILGLLLAFFIMTFVMKTSVHDSYEYMKDAVEEDMQKTKAEGEAEEKAKQEKE